MFGNQNEPVSFERDCVGILIPLGDKITIPAGTQGIITQALGGSFTVYVDGNLYRVDGSDADALGKEPLLRPELAKDAGDEDFEKAIWEQMKTCFDPEIPINIVDLGLVYVCTLETADDGTRKVAIEMTLTAPGCGMGEILVEDVRSKVSLIPTVTQVDVELVFDPPWNQSMMSEAARLQTGLMY